MAIAARRVGLDRIDSGQRPGRIKMRGVAATAVHVSLQYKGGEAMPEVMIVGGGIAGLTSALRLLQRGFDVTLMEQDNFLGGMLRATLCDDPECKVRHEHSYHMFTNGYPGFYHEALFAWLKLLCAPYAMGAKAQSGALDMMGGQRRSDRHVANLEPNAAESREAT